MISLTQGQISEQITVTLNEKRSLTSGYYLFRFIHILTNAVINKIYNFIEDNSPNPDRYNEFDIDTSAVFLNQPVGMWRYEVYEQAGSSNTDPANATEVERGIMTLVPAIDFEFKKYDQPTTYIAYAG